MNKKKNNRPKNKYRKSNYTAPAIEVIDIQVTQSVLGGSPKAPDGIPGGGFW